MSEFPPKLAAIVALFEGLAEGERRETLIAYAEKIKKFQPGPGERFLLEDIRKDAECTDTVGIFLQIVAGKVRFRVTLGPEVQTLTRALAVILCQGLEGSTPQQVLKLKPDFVVQIVGSQLIRQRAQTVYYLLRRMQQICADSLAQ